MPNKPEIMEVFPRGAVQEFLALSPMKPDLLYPLQQSATSNFGEFWPDRDTIPAHDVIARGLERLMHCICADFPMLTHDLWLRVLDATSQRTELLLEEVLSVWPDTQECCSWDDENSRTDLTPIQQIAIAMVAEHFWSMPLKDRSLRNSVATVSRRPEFASFSDDPEPYEFWSVSDFKWQRTGDIASMRLTHKVYANMDFEAVLTIVRAKKGFSAKGLNALKEYSGPTVTAYQGRAIDDAIRAGAIAFFANLEEQTSTEE
ncbi:hypothetical protein [Ruegeria arenilitoris]|uniref:hypothetical protein n=1 Tax=Ruegeria arenilitoris TaxID=1173585 RepID=UPI00147AF08A|nr:hypothetical protein [Ruegeria arenilitoris]